MVSSYLFGVSSNLIFLLTLQTALCVQVVLDRGSGTRCTVDLHGATVISWTVRGKEQFFVSREAIFDNVHPIRGGVPFVFPKFADWGDGRPSHGFARILPWKMTIPPTTEDGGNVLATFTLEDGAYTRSLWDFLFHINYTLILEEDNLRFNVKIYNPSKTTPLSFEILLHTYFKLDDVSKYTVGGLKDLDYIDKEHRSHVDISEWTDRIYENALEDHSIFSETSDSGWKLTKLSNLTDTVVWNPWEEGSKTISDMADEEYKVMICVEAGSVTKQMSLQPEESIETGQILHALSSSKGCYHWAHNYFALSTLILILINRTVFL